MNQEEDRKVVLEEELAGYCQEHPEMRAILHDFVSACLVSWVVVAWCGRKEECKVRVVD